MTLPRPIASLVLLVLACTALSVNAADRMRPGLWTGTTTIGARVIPNTSCISQADADAMNGDAKAVQGYLETVIPPSVCKLSGVKVDGGKVVYVASCGGQPGRTITTTYHGTSSEGGDSSGTKNEARLTGACK